MDEVEACARRLRLSNLLREPALRSAIGSLAIPPGSRGLDAGCGIGLHTVWLAQAAGPAGHVTALDLSPDLLARARRHAAKSRAVAQISFRQGDVRTLPFAGETFDWVWSTDTVYAGAVGDPVAIARELARVVKPGGQVALLFWSTQKLLPGHPLLEAQLESAFAQGAPYLSGVAPDLQYPRALGWLRRAGLADLDAQTFIATFHAPLDHAMREALAMSFGMLWGDAVRRLSAGDQALFARLCDPQSPEHILDSPDYYGFVTYSMFRGRVPQRAPAR